MGDVSRIRYRRWLVFVACAVSLCGLAASAQDAIPTEISQSTDQGVHMTHIPKTSTTVMGTVNNLHTIAATVTHADSGTGIVDVMAGGMPLKVYFPPATMAGLHAGDQIKLSMGFSR